MRNEFATSLSKRLLDVNENAFCSPYSVMLALGMCAAGAKGRTRKAMASVLGCPEDDAKLNDFFEALIKGMEGNEAYLLSVANSVWRDKAYSCYESYRSLLQTRYSAESSEVDFAANPSSAASDINKWVSEKTADKIKDLVKAESVEKIQMMLVIAIYFKGSWRDAFEKDNTRSQSWHAAGGVRSVQMMSQSDKLDYYEDTNMQIVDLPYKGNDLSMMVVLPLAKDGLAQVEKDWDISRYEYVLNHFRLFDVDLSLPKFKLETSYSLTAVLKQMGLDIAFSDDADFTGIGEDRLKISDVNHKAYVEVDEKGTEAAAATSVGMMLCTASRPTKKMVFTADHPFMFLIRDLRNGQILFCGHVVDFK